VVRLLNTEFVNTWVLVQKLPALRDGPAGDARRLARAATAALQPKSPVDCMVFTPDGELVGVRPVHDVLSHRAGPTDAYLTFLKEALEKVKK
jgi:hypothetical protein